MTRPSSMSPLNIDVIAPPFHGHLHPILGIARVLREHATVRVLTTSDAASRVKAAGLELFPILVGQAAAVWRVANTDQPVRGRPWMLWHQFQQNMKLLPPLRADVESAWQVRRPDLALVDFTLPSVGHWAQALGIRWWTSHPSPLAIETHDGTPTYLGGWKPPASWIGRGRDAVGRGCIRQFKRLMFALYGRQLRKIGVPAVYRTDGSEQVYSNELILALGLRELEFPRSWPAAARFIGPVFYTPPGDHAAVHWDATRKNVLVTLGTHLPYARQEILRRVSGWARELPDVFLHYTMGGNAASSAANGPNWRAYRYIDYESELGRFDGIVHHGGSGITYYALRAAVPTVVWPQDYDQFDFASRLEHRGLAVWCRTPSAVPTALKRAILDRAMKERVNDFAAKLQGDPWRAAVRSLLHEQGFPIATACE